MKRFKKGTGAAVILLLCSSVALSACSKSEKNKGTESVSLTESSGSTADAGNTETLGTDAQKEIPEDKKELLNKMQKAIESQYPEESFSDIPTSELKPSIALLENSYIFAGRETSSGRAYVAGVCLTEENPLEGMTCSSGGGISGFSTSQFADGRFLLMEKSGEDKEGFSGVYDALQQGESGIDYLLEAAARGVTMTAPENAPFLRVMMVHDGIPYPEFVRLTAAEYDAMSQGSPVEVTQGERGTLLLCEDKSGLERLWNQENLVVTQEMIDFAKEKCSYDNQLPQKDGQFVKAGLEARLNGEIRTEVLENRGDVETLVRLISEASPDGDFSEAGHYAGTLTMYANDGTEIIIQIPEEGNGCVFGSSVFGSLKESDIDSIWSMFSTIDGWKRYGSRILMEMTKPSFGKTEDNLTFTLENLTGGPVQFILSPIIYKKEAGSWKRLDAVAGFCGFLTPMQKEKEDLSIPWNGAFLTEGAGTYKLEIQIMPEEGIRFPISAIFQVEG